MPAATVVYGGPRVDMAALRRLVIQHVQQAPHSSIPPRIRVTKSGELVVRIH